MNRVILNPVSKRFVDTGEKKQVSEETRKKISLALLGGVKHYPEVTLNGDHEQIIIGSTLGDAGLYLGGNSIHYRFQVSHSEKDSNYLYWKYDHLPLELFRKPPFRGAQSSTPNSGVVDKSKLYPNLICLRTIQHPIFDQYHTLLYNGNGKKVISTKALNSIKPLGLAIWYQDDGTLYFPPHRATPSISLAVYSFGLNGARLIQEWLRDKFQIETQTIKTPRFQIRISLGSSYKFLKIIEPFIILERKSGRYYTNYRKPKGPKKQIILDPITKKFNRVGNDAKNRD